MPQFEDRCSFPRDAVTACGLRLLTMWRVKAGQSYRRALERSLHDSRDRQHQAGRNLVVVRTDHGSGRVVVRGESHDLAKGSLMLFEFPELEKYHTVGNTWHFWWVELVPGEPVHLPLRTPIMTPMLDRERSRCEAVFDRLQSESVEQRHLAAALWQGLFYEWWAGAGLRVARMSRGELAMQRIADAVKRQPELPWSVEEMAAAGGMSPSALRQTCLKALGTTPARIRIRIKMEHAQEYLRRGDRNVSEVAEALGFCDPFHFSKVYKRHFGSNPSGAKGEPRS